MNDVELDRPLHAAAAEDERAEERADDADDDVEEDALLRVGAHHQAGEPADDAAEDRARSGDAKHAFLPLIAAQRRRRRS